MTPEPTPAPATSSTGDQVAEIEQLGKLKEEGLLTEEEFAAKKKEILEI